MTTLYKRTASNIILEWSIEQFGKKYTVTWKHLHSHNSTTETFLCENEEQAADEIISRINKMINRNGYGTNKLPPRADRPMLAQKWEEHVAKVESGAREHFKRVLLQPKLDGIRCIATSDTMVSRRNLPIKSVPVVQAALKLLPTWTKLDGELYVHNTDLQTMQELVLRETPHTYHQIVKYHVYDLVDTETDQQQRYNKLKFYIDQLTRDYAELVQKQRENPPQMKSELLPEECPIVLVDTQVVHNNNDTELSAYTKEFYDTLDKAHKKATDDKYEGLIIRNAYGPYAINERSPNLLKMKVRLDEEFQIIDVSEGHKKTGIFVCQTEEGITFEATPKATLGIKQNILRFKNKWIGGNVTVEYETLSNTRVPLKPVAVAWRQGEKQ